MNGEVELSTLLSDMSPLLDDRDWVFVMVDDEAFVHLAPNAIASFREAEGVTLVLPALGAHDCEHMSGPMARITLEVHSSLEAVGLTAAVAGALATEGISANVIAAYYHDHIFVPEASAEHAMNVLRALSAGSK